MRQQGSWRGCAAGLDRQIPPLPGAWYEAKTRTEEANTVLGVGEGCGGLESVTKFLLAASKLCACPCSTLTSPHEASTRVSDALRRGGAEGDHLQQLGGSSLLPHLPSLALAGEQ